MKNEKKYYRKKINILNINYSLYEYVKNTLKKTLNDVKMCCFED